MIVVTGGAGFIGSGLIWALNQRGISDILVVDQLNQDSRWINLRALEYTDYLDKDDFIELVKNRQLPGNIETILHMGACASTAEKDAGFLVRNNFIYSKILIKYAVAQGIRLIYASSAATYGNGEQGYDDDESILPALRPLNIYGYSKHMTDLWAWRQGLLSQVAAVKFSNVFGPNEYHKGEMRSVVLKAFEQMQQAGKISLFKSYRPEYGDGEQVRDFIYIKDAVAITLHLADHPEANGIFNVGTGRARSWNCLARAVARALEKKIVIEYIDMPEQLREQYQYHTELPTEKLTAAGWNQPLFELEKGIDDYVRNYLVTTRFLGD